MTEDSPTAVYFDRMWYTITAVMTSAAIWMTHVAAMQDVKVSKLRNIGPLLCKQALLQATLSPGWKMTVLLISTFLL